MTPERLKCDSETIRSYREITREPAAPAMAHGLEQPVMLVFSLGAVDDLRWGNGTEVFCELGNDVDSPLMHGNQLTSIWITSLMCPSGSSTKATRRPNSGMSRIGSGTLPPAAVARPTSASRFSVT